MELESLLNRYLSKDISVSTYGTINENIVNDIIKNCEQFEEPDIIANLSNDIYAIEHFEFDSYEQLKKGKGSDFKKKKSFMEKEITEEIDQILKKENNAVVHKCIDSTASLDNYYENFIKSFNKHYLKIKNYRKRIVDKYGNKKIHFCFFTEDVSPLGSYFLDKERKINILLPIYSNKIIELLNNSKEIEYIIVGTYCMNEYKLFIIANTNEAIEQFKKGRKEFNSNDYLSLAPQTTGFATKI